MLRILAAAAAVLLCLGTAPRAAAETYPFRDQALGEDALGICLTDLPEGTLTLEGRTLAAGDVLTADQAARACVSAGPGEALEVAYLLIGPDGLTPAAVTVAARENQVPVAQDLSLETYRDLPVQGRLKVSDPEGQPLTCTLVRQPRRGSVTIAGDGSFTYTPKKHKVGVDSFTYTAADPDGGVSREATVTIAILKPGDEEVYPDTQGRSCRFAAEWMRHTGIFQGETVAEQTCFGPDKAVTRGQFLAMLVKALDLPPEPDLQTAADAPQWLRPYLAAAVRAGLTADLPQGQRFDDSPITGAEAAVLLHAGLNAARKTPWPPEQTTAAPVEAPRDDAAPAWAREALTVLAAGDILLDPDAALTRADAALALYQLTRLTSQ